MTRACLLSACACVALTACSREVLPEFRSAQERACYFEARETLRPNQRLIRAGSNFAVATTEQSFVKKTEVSQVFVDCMGGSAAPDAEPAEPRLVLSRDQLAVWDRLSDAEKRAALDFIREGGTFDDYLKSRAG